MSKVIKWDLLDSLGGKTKATQLAENSPDAINKR